MTRVVFKYKAEPIQQIVFTGSARVIKFGYQQDIPYLWCEENLSDPSQTWVFAIYGTGWPISDDGMTHLETQLAPDGHHIWHLYGRRVV